MNNSAGNSVLVRLALVLLTNTLVATTANAAEEDGSTQTEPLEPDVLMPDIELLEFLGSFQTESGEWIDPEMLLNDDFEELFGLAARMDEIANQSDENENAASNQQDN